MRTGEFLLTNRPVVNLYLEPSVEVEVVSQTIYGKAVERVAEAGEWARIRTVDRYEGWALREGFLPLVAGAKAASVRVVQLTANVYREPDVKRCAALLQLPWEARLEVRADDGAAGPEWLPVRLLDGREAYVLRGDVSGDEDLLSLERMLELAKRFVGITYTWGGTSSFGFDCSGFVQMLFRQMGVTLPRDAQAQCDWEGFRAAERESLAAGDALFFGERVAEITHVGLYVGEGRFVHDTTQGHPGIQVSSLADAPWNARLMAQRRRTV